MWNVLIYFIIYSGKFSKRHLNIQHFNETSQIKTTENSVCMYHFDRIGNWNTWWQKDFLLYIAQYLDYTANLCQLYIWDCLLKIMKLNSHTCSCTLTTVWAVMRPCDEQSSTLSSELSSANCDSTRKTTMAQVKPTPQWVTSITGLLRSNVVICCNERSKISAVWSFWIVTAIVSIH